LAYTKRLSCNVTSLITAEFYQFTILDVPAVERGLEESQPPWVEQINSFFSDFGSIRIILGNGHTKMKQKCIR